MNDNNQGLKENINKEQFFLPLIFLFLIGLWFILYFRLINIYSCSFKNADLSCIILPLIAWATWLISSLGFFILCLFKILKEKKILDILIFLGYGWLYGLTLIILFK
jgi:hypothetical protein